MNEVNISQLTAHRTLFAGLWPAPMPLLSAVSAGCSSPKKRIVNHLPNQKNGHACGVNTIKQPKKIIAPGTRDFS
jgi:hypothetical protein